MVLATATPAPARPHLIDAGGGEVRETHISWVFLTPDRAYKVKKPIVLPFLDYRTPERRHLLCREEVALNRRLAPELYLGVRSLVRAGDGLRLADEGDPRAVDFAVEMRRYDESATFAARLCAGAAGPEHAAAAGARLAAFHAAAEIDRCATGARAVERRARRQLRHAARALARARRDRAARANRRRAHSWLRSGTSSMRAPARDSCATATATCG